MFTLLDFGWVEYICSIKIASELGRIKLTTSTVISRCNSYRWCIDD